MQTKVFILVITIMIATIASANAAPKGLVSLIYHRFGEDSVPLTNTRLDQLEDHIRLIWQSGRTPISGETLLDLLGKGQPLPDNTVMVSVDDAYESFYDTAWPLFREAGIPVTLFVATDPVDQGLPGYLSWEQIRTLMSEGVTIAHHGAAHLHMIEAGAEQSIKDIERASKRFKEELGFVPQLFAYPYGEFSLETKTVIEKAGFVAAFAQHSGAIAAHDDVLTLKRFALNERYGTQNRVRTILNTRPLSVFDIQPQDTIVEDQPVNLSFSLTEVPPAVSTMTCFPSHRDFSLNTTIEGARVTVATIPPFTEGRNRINCTAAVGDGSFYWTGFFFYRPPVDGPKD